MTTFADAWIQRLGRELLKWRTTIETGLGRHLAFKMNFALQIIGPALVFYFIKFQLWQAIFDSHPTGHIGPYDLQTMLDYQSFMLIVTLIAQGYSSTNLSEEIRLGKISTYLIYPFSFWKHHFCVFAAFEFIQLVIATITIGILSYSGIIDIATVADLSHIAIGMVYGIAVAMCWFSIQFLLGIFGFWLEETWVLRVLFITVGNFLSGAIIPLDLYPEWLQSSLTYTPFPYLTYVPVKILMGQYEGSVGFAFAIVGFWTVVTTLAGRFVWQRGVRLYTAAGM